MRVKVNKKLITLILVLLLMFSIFLYFLNYKHNYTLEYKINDFKIIEEYKKDKDYYIFKVIDKDAAYKIMANNYVNKRYLVTDVEKNNDCISLKGKVKLYDVCKNEDGYYYNNDYEEFKEIRKYKNVSINNLGNSKVLLWNYNGFLYLSNDANKSIKLFNNDIYNINLVYQSNNILLVPDYTDKYKFEKIYLINFNSGKVSNYKLRYEVYFDSYFLGGYKDKVYLFDNKSELEYYFDVKKEDIFISKYQILDNNKWVSSSKEKLKNNKLSFKNNTIFSYEIKDNNLYLNDYLVDLDVKRIIKVDNHTVYYLKDDILYSFSPYSKSEALLKYSEWNFNYNNMIFIYNK